MTRPRFRPPYRSWETKFEPPEKPSIWKWLKDNSESVKIIFAVIAGIYVALQYKANDHIDHVKASTESIDQFYKSDNYTSLLRLEDFWLSEHNVELRRRLENKEITSETYRNILFNLVKMDYYGDLRKAARGLQSVSICGIQGRCDGPTICMYLFHTMEDFRCNFREEIADISYANGACFIDEMDYFLDTYCKDWLTIYLGLSSYNNIKDDYCVYNQTKKVPLIGGMCIDSIIYKSRETFFDRFLK
jgi:hypothetical protein